MKDFWKKISEFATNQARKKSLNLALIVPLVIFVFTILLWEHYVSSDLIYNRVIISNVIILLGTLFALSVGILIWSLERNYQYARSTRTFFDNIIKSTVAPMLVIDLNTNIRTVNQGALKLLEYKETELAGQPIEIILSAEGPLKAGTPELFNKGFLAAVECNFKTKEGKQIPVLFSASVIKDAFENRHRIVCVAQDISERKVLEQQLFRARQLEFVGRLASGVAHDFNNLLSGMAGLSEFLLMEIDRDSPLRKDAEQINQLAVSGSNLTRQLLAFSRRKMTRPEVVDLNEVILRLSNVIRKILGESIELVTIPDQELDRIYVDPGQFEQVLLNLITNARDAMRDGGKLFIQTANASGSENADLKSLKAKAESYVMLLVQDTGHGMPEEVKKRIFDPFFTTKEEGKGVGLGLATAYEIIQAAEGHFIVESKVNEGTTFKIYFPKTENVESKSEESGEQYRASSGKERILLVEDEPLVKSVAARALRLHGYEVIEMSNGSEALHWVKENPNVVPDLLLTDIVMPQIGGKDLAKKLLETHPGMKILFTSGYITEAQNLDKENLPRAAFIQKPFTPTSLSQKVRDVLDVKL